MQAIAEKPCNQCEETKPLEEFYRKHNRPFGRTSLCRQCMRADNKSYRQTPEGKIINSRAVKKYQQTAKGGIVQKRASKKYQQTKKGKICHAQAIKTYRALHSKEIQARMIVYQAIANGILIRPSICSNCNKERRISAHHEDYDKPLEVIWLCDKCHGELSRNNQDQRVKKDLQSQDAS